MSVCPDGGLANRRIDGAWKKVPCDPATPWVCWSHKMRSMRGAIKSGRDPLSGGMPFKQTIEAGLTQLGMAQSTYAAARADGHDLQRA